MRSVQAVIFDWGGTLTPWHDIDLHAQWYAYAEAYDAANAHSLATSLMRAEVERWRLQRESLGATSTGALDAIFIAHDIDLDSARHLRALALYEDFWAPHTFADPDARETLLSLRGQGLRIGVLSNTMWPRSYHREVFVRDDLDDVIDAACYTSEMPVAKPHAAAFQAIAEALDVGPQECVYVGDRLWDDVHGAQAAGMRAIWIPHSAIPSAQVPDNSATPDAVAHRLLDVVEIVRGWQAADV